PAKPGRAHPPPPGRGGPRPPAQAAARSPAADENTPVAGEVAHADAVTQNPPAANGAAWVYSHNPHRLILLPEGFSQFIDQGALARTRRAGNADDMCPAGGRIQPHHRLPGVFFL